jgi:anti-anti-sigma regulatory factor
MRRLLAEEGEAAMTDGRATLELGDHVCASYATDRERRDGFTVVARAGVRDGHKVLCFVEASGGMPAALGGWLAGAVPAAGPGQVRVQAVGDGAAAGGRVDYLGMIDGLAEEINRAMREGYPGIRLVGDMAWTLRGDVDTEALVDYEAAANELFGDGRAVGLCQYDLRRFDGATLRAVAAAHPGMVTGRGDGPLLRFAFAPRGITLVGEVDASNRRAFSAIVSRLSTLPAPATLDATDLRFIDAAGAAAIVAVAAVRAGRQTVVRCPRGVAQMLRLVGAAQVPDLVVERSDV